MKVFTLLAIVWLGSAVAGLVQDNWSQGRMEEVIRRLEGDLSAALRRGDVTLVDALLAEDYIEITAQGAIRKKTDVMELVRRRAAAPPAQSIGPEVTIEESKLRTFGDTAILVGLKKTRYQHMQYQISPDPAQAPPQVSDHERFMKVFVKRDGRWRLVASQTTPVVQTQPGLTELGED